MLFHKKAGIKIRIISIILVWAFVLPDLAISSPIDASRSALAPPLAMNPPCKMVKLPDGRWDVITSNEDGIDWFRETFESIGDSNLHEEFRKKWEFVHISFLIAQALKLQISKYTLIDLIRRYVEVSMRMESKDLRFKGIDDMRNAKKIIAFSLPIINEHSGEIMYNLIYSLEKNENAKMIIRLDSETNVYVSIESEQDISKKIIDLSQLNPEEREKIERFGIAFRSMYHGGKLFDPFDDMTLEIGGLAALTRMVDDPGLMLIKSDIWELFNTLKIIAYSFGAAVMSSKKGTLTAQKGERYISELKEVLEGLRIQKGKIGEIQTRLIPAFRGKETSRREISEWLDSLTSLIDCLIEKIKSRVEFAAGTPSQDKAPLEEILDKACKNVEHLRIDDGGLSSKRVTGDRLALASAIRNMLKNAEHFAELKNGKDADVRLTAAEERGFIRIDISDNGPGILPELLELDPVMNRPKLFNLNVSRRKEGTGLGLTETWYTVKDHGGTVEVLSEPGKGATFTIRLPLTSLSTKIERLKLLGAGYIAVAAQTCPERFSFILDDPLLNDEEFWANPAKLEETLRSTKSLEEKFGINTQHSLRQLDINRYFCELQQHLSAIVNAAIELCADPEHAEAKFVFLGRAVDPVYWTAKYLLGREMSSRLILMDFGYFSPKSLDIARANPDAFQRYLKSLGLKKDEKIVIVDEFSAIYKLTPGPVFPDEVADLFTSLGYTNLSTVNMAFDTTVSGGYDAMVWLSDDYNSGRTFIMDLKNGEWEYNYSDYATSSSLPIRRNGEYFAWLSRKQFYDYLLTNGPNLEEKVRKVREMQSTSQGTSLIDFASFTPQRIDDLYAKEALDMFKRRISEVIQIPAKKRDFDNTIKAIEDALVKFGEAVGPAAFMFEVSSNEAVSEAARLVHEKMGKEVIGLYMNEELYRAILEYAEKNKIEDLKGEDRKLFDEIIRLFELNGMKIEKDKKEELKTIKERRVELRTSFRKNLKKNRPYLVVTREELNGVVLENVEGLGPDQEEKGKLRLPVNFKTYDIIMTQANSEALRQRYQYATEDQAHDLNFPVFQDINDGRQKEAALLGYSSYAEEVLDDNMAESPETVLAFLEKYKDLLKGKCKEELAELLKLKQKDNPEATCLNSWDIPYYINKQKAEMLGRDLESLREYFSSDTVVKETLGFFENLFNLKFTEVKGSVWHKDVRIIQVTDRATGSMIGHMYLDLYYRDEKGGSEAYANSLISGRELGDGKRQHPATVMVTNFKENLTHREAQTFLHEFGHLMHHMLGKSRYERFFGTSVARDFSEVPSMWAQNLVWQKEFLKKITGGKMPDELMDKLITTRKVAVAYEEMRVVARSLIDMKCHAGKIKPSLDMIQEIFRECGIELPKDVPYLREGRIGHFVGGYAAGYYSYLWSHVYAQDIFSTFMRDGVMLSGEELVQRGAALRDGLLSRGGSIPEKKQLKKVLSREPSDEAYLRYLGIDPSEGILTTETERVNGVLFTDEIKMIQAKEEKALSFIAVGTDWMKGYRKENALEYNILNPYISAIKKYCEEHNIQFIVDSDEAIVSSIARVKEASPNARGIVLAGKEAVEKLADDKNIFTASVNGGDIGVDNYIRLVEMLRVLISVFRLDSITTKDIEIIQKEHPQLGVSLVNGRLIFIPHAEPVDYEDINIKALYTAQVSA